jgi:ABC transport system ATP-binding/permease protein
VLPLSDVSVSGPVISSPQLPTEIPIGNYEIVVGRSAASHVVLARPDIGSQHARLFRQADRIVVTDLDSATGTFVNESRIRKKVLEPGDVVRFGSEVCYRAWKTGLELDQRGMSLSADSLELWMQKRQQPLWRRLLSPGQRRWSQKKQPAVRELTFRIESNKFVGVLGPSGGGKTTLLSCLAGIIKPEFGEIIFDDVAAIDQNLPRYLSMIGFVPQKDVFFSPELSVRETLRTALAIIEGEPLGDPRDQDLKIGIAVEKVSLEQVLDQPVAKLSGGEKKRLAVAVALLRKPRLLLLDEPTAGLDPSTEAKLMEEFKKCAKRGTTVVCTTHLLGNLDLFDSLLVLGTTYESFGSEQIRVGRLAYQGPPTQLLKSLQIDQPDHVQLYERLQNLQTAQREQPVHIRFGVASEPAPSHSDRAQSPDEIDVGRIGRQLCVLVRREWTCLSRDRAALALVFFQPVLLASLIGICQFRLNPKFGHQYQFARIPYFYAILTGTWLGMNNSVREFVRGRGSFVREQIIGLQSAAFFLSKAAFLSLIGVLQVCAFILIFKTVGPAAMYVLRDADAWNPFDKVPLYSLFPLMFSTYATGVAIGLAVSAVMRSQEAAVAILPLLIMPQLLLSEVGTFLLSNPDNDRQALRPMAIALTRDDNPSPPSPEEHNWAARVVDVASLAFPSRPATMITAKFMRNTEDEYGNDFGRRKGQEWSRGSGWVADVMHLESLLVIYWLVAWYVYARQSKTWPQDRRNWSD